MKNGPCLKSFQICSFHSITGLDQATNKENDIFAVGTADPSPSTKTTSSTRTFRSSTTVTPSGDSGYSYLEAPSISRPTCQKIKESTYLQNITLLFASTSSLIQLTTTQTDFFVVAQMSVDLVGFVILVGVGCALPRLKYVLTNIPKEYSSEMILEVA